MQTDSIKGITFDYQTQTAADMASLIRSIFKQQDGPIFGCEVSQSGSVGAKIEAGGFIACGRFLRVNEPIIIPASASDSSSRYARISYLIDLSNDASATEFTQGWLSIQDAATLDEFSELEDDDVNNGGTKYRVEICVLRLDDEQNTTGIVRSWNKITI